MTFDTLKKGKLLMKSLSKALHTVRCSVHQDVKYEGVVHPNGGHKTIAITSDKEVTIYGAQLNTTVECFMSSDFEELIRGIVSRCSGIVIQLYCSEVIAVFYKRRPSQQEIDNIDEILTEYTQYNKYNLRWETPYSLSSEELEEVKKLLIE